MTFEGVVDQTLQIELRGQMEKHSTISWHSNHSWDSPGKKPVVKWIIMVRDQVQHWVEIPSVFSGSKLPSKFRFLGTKFDIELWTWSVLKSYGKALIACQGQ